MLHRKVNYIDNTILEQCIQEYEEFRLRDYKFGEYDKNTPLINIVGVGQLGKYFIDYCNYNNRWNNDNKNFSKLLSNSEDYKIERKLQKIAFITLDEYMDKEHNKGYLNIFLYNLSELGEFDKFINKLLQINNSYNVIFGVKTKHSKLQFDIIINRLSKDTKIPIVLVDEEKLLEETNNYIIYELYNFARSMIEN